MALITESTFDPLHQYMGVVQQQGVPFLDADWNELDEMHRFARRIFLKWFVGDGVPNDSDIFRIEGTGLTNDFVIHSGIDPSTIPAGTSNQEIGLRYVGYALVDGLEVFVQNTIKFSGQPLHVSNNPSPALLATTLGGGAINALKLPGADGVVVVYLDVWERLLTPDEESKLILPAIGIQSCARIKRDWVVRADRKLPTQGDPAPLYAAGHSYYQLATITRHNGVNEVNAGDVQDTRQTRVSLVDFVQRMAIAEQAVQDHERRLGKTESSVSNHEQRLKLLERYTLAPMFDPSPGQFSPKAGATNQKIILHGRNFNFGTVDVQFNGTEATIVGTPTFNQIVVSVPAGITGSTKITVKTDGGSVVSDDPFNVISVPFFAPSPGQFDPKFGTVGSNVTLHGTNFNIGTTRVLFGSASATIVGSPTAAQVVATVPQGVAGGVKITISNDQGSATSDDTFNVLVAPTFANSPGQFSPKAGSVGQAVTLHGQNFGSGISPTRVFFDATEATPVTVSADGTQISTTVPSRATGQVNITVTTDAGSATSSDVFTIT